MLQMCIQSELSELGMCKFPDMVTNYHILLGQKHYKFIFLPLWRSEVQYQIQSSKMKVWAGLHFLLKFQEKIYFFPFQLLEEAHLGSRPLSSSLISGTEDLWISDHSISKEIIHIFELPNTTQSDNTPALMSGVTEQLSQPLQITWELRASWRLKPMGKKEKMKR